jgi:hypothetical protein
MMPVFVVSKSCISYRLNNNLKLGGSIIKVIGYVTQGLSLIYGSAITQLPNRSPPSNVELRIRGALPPTCNV